MARIPYIFDERRTVVPRRSLAWRSTIGCPAVRRRGVRMAFLWIFAGIFLVIWLIELGRGRVEGAGRHGF